MSDLKMVCPRCWGSKVQYLKKVCKKCELCSATGSVPDQKLTKNFFLSEFVASQTAIRNRIANEPTPEHVENLKALCEEILEPLRAFAGPIHVNSGLRVPELNAALSGSSGTSAHQSANASDLNPLKKSIKECMDWLVKSKLKYDQAIYEGTWLHVGRLSPAGKVRQQALMMFPSPKTGKPAYSLYDPKDQRVV